MSISFYQVSKQFYKNQLQQDIEYRLQAHKEVLEDDFSEHTLHHVVLMERRGQESSFIIFDSQFGVIDHSYPIDSERLIFYREWISHLGMTSKTEFVEIMANHIPHVWSAVPIMQNQAVLGYLFIDQDTGEFEQSKLNLLLISLIMTLFSLLLSGSITIYLSKRWTAPLVEVRHSTRAIAKGNFDIVLTANGKDEIADLKKDISSMAEQLKKYRDTRQQFLSNVSHDLRTPLTYIKAYAAILKEKSTESDVQEQSTVIHQEAVRMERLVNDIFQLVRLDEGKFAIVKEKEDLVELGMRTVQKAKVAASQKEINLHFSYDPSEIIANVDPIRMEQVILNLLSNAIRHTRTGGEIKLIIERKDARISITVQDNGEGIPEKDLKHIWERFYRVDQSRSTKHGGSGLGLAITKQLVVLHGGNIHVSSVRNEGTVFTIYLPMDEGGVKENL
ncbi:HAMP domain-containing histidine kinase [Alkalihalobacillus sp. MEB130]|uniref:sensor histidine kinase n=1 Tax=Alkalihalobacillus sp. MEB130 TaxID=2976704 RepID=UPI0028DD9E21|nr:HAMP domain-containing sensor histidine kinase [Alkalihalobacillus sp. MEB130]MDT8861596.1 HAMP domain-containing histidine kinase [Alkalihalobacillus sp. MEB130]